ncbi:hypothetical protein [Streptomyces sp. NPDC057428]|uniref:hypothetical protein n=1 Tax=Streptomyces sp. NPDC057428 TaxID=3346129 RepID=UPI003675D237
MAKLPSDAVLKKLYDLGVTDKELAEQYGVTVQAVNKRFHKLGLPRRPTIVRRVNEALGQRWDLNHSKGRHHHAKYAGKALKAFLRRQLGDDELGPTERHRAQQWEARMQAGHEVLCYDPDTEDGWYYRARRPEDGRMVIDWPEDWPVQPDPEFREALELPVRER